MLFFNCASVETGVLAYPFLFLLSPSIFIVQLYIAFYLTEKSSGGRLHVVKPHEPRRRPLLLLHADHLDPMALTGGPHSS